MYIHEFKGPFNNYQNTGPVHICFLLQKIYWPSRANRKQTARPVKWQFKKTNCPAWFVIGTLRSHDRYTRRKKVIWCAPPNKIMCSPNNYIVRYDVYNTLGWNRHHPDMTWNRHLTKCLHILYRKSLFCY